ncbi:uncharacterized protein LOC105689780 isoform X1 [Athalia rosae]|uniref:uncharacterized protein LOC105689780 isoform X1 n=2 Tax=Athalia rosae TaxID=37344 RepID=UPI00203450EA|nr:uncharacterized protein LOC105689780 isoform X1 [Athalia rosae]
MLFFINGNLIIIVDTQGKKHQPVRISMAHFTCEPGSRNASSSRKTIRQPIRNIHKLLESPKRNARKRLDNLYGSPKKKDLINPGIIKAQELSVKKLAPKITAVTPRKTDQKTSKKSSIQHTTNTRQSRLIQPGTIAGSFLKRQSLMARNTSVRQADGNVPLIKKKPKDKSQSTNVLKESLEHHDKSHIYDDVFNSPSPISDVNQSTTNEQVINGINSPNSHNKASLLVNIPEEKEKSELCLNCSMNIADRAKNVSTLIDTSNQILVNSKCIEEDLGSKSSKKFEAGEIERPTVIVMQKEIAVPPQDILQDLHQSMNVSSVDGSYTEILNQRASMDCKTNETLLFKRMETVCSRLANAEANDSDEMIEYASRLKYMNYKALLMRQKHLTECITLYENNLIGLKHMLEGVNVQLASQENAELKTKFNRSSDLQSEELSPLICQNAANMAKNLKTHLAVGVLTENHETIVENAKCMQESSTPKISRQRRSKRRSVNVECQSKENDATEKSSDDLVKSSPTIAVPDILVKNVDSEEKTPMRRRSARIASKNANLTISDKENSPVIETKKINGALNKTVTSTPTLVTPARRGNWGRRSERPLREYMVLKSAMKFLNTPDSRRYHIGPDEKVQIRDSLGKADEELRLTDKLLKELHDLYATP